MSKVRWSEYSWDPDTIKYLKSKDKKGCEGEFCREVYDFVKQNVYTDDTTDYNSCVQDLFGIISGKRANIAEYND